MRVDRIRSRHRAVRSRRLLRAPCDRARRTRSPTAALAFKLPRAVAETPRTPASGSESAARSAGIAASLRVLASACTAALRMSGSRWRVYHAIVSPAASLSVSPSVSSAAFVSAAESPWRSSSTISGLAAIPALPEVRTSSRADFTWAASPLFSRGSTSGGRRMACGSAAARVAGLARGCASAVWISSGSSARAAANRIPPMAANARAARGPV